MAGSLLTATAVAGFVSVAGTISAASGPERSLAGIPIFAPGSQVTRKFGNPSRILVGGVSAATAGQGPRRAARWRRLSGLVGAATPAVAAGIRAAGALPLQVAVAGPTAGLVLARAVPGCRASVAGFPGARAAATPAAVAATLAVVAAIRAAGAAIRAAAAATRCGRRRSERPVDSGEPSAVTLVYDRALGGDLEFTISPDKRVVQIRETGYSGAYGTARDIKLGTTYSQVVARYGYPEDTSIAGSIVNIDYKDTLHCGFQFLDQKLVGIIVAAPD